MKRGFSLVIALAVVAATGALAWQWRDRFFAGAGPASAAPRSGLDRLGWLGSPGPLSAAHAALSGDCRACHVPFRRVADANCLGCHAKNLELLRRRDTAFHAEARRCVTCHSEHQGRDRRISRMEHGVLDARVSCTSCHVDRHQALFGPGCSDCHQVDRWKVDGFRHPSPASRLCSECHQAPPSHSMMHFEMVDRRMTGQVDATVEQCWRCHTTDHWNNIVGVGFYKHH